VRKRLCAGVVSAWLVALVPLTAANVWESKPFNTWTDKELEKVLTSSPWAGKSGISYVQQRANQQPIVEEAVVTWASARVMRQALVREEYGATPDIPKEAEGVIAQTPPFYMVTVKISKGVNSAGHARRASDMKKETFLLLHGKPPIPATQAEGQVLDVVGKATKTPQTPAGSSGRGGSGPAFAVSPAQRGGSGGTGGSGATGGGSTGGAGGTTGGSAPRGGSPVGRGGNFGERPTTASIVIFRFPRDPITPEDKEVEFVTRLCGGGGGGRGAPTGGGNPPPSGGAAGGAPFELAAVPQRGGGDLGGQGVRMGDPLPACNYQVKKTFKLKDMTVKGELQL
jgi:hypothetical protein